VILWDREELRYHELKNPVEQLRGWKLEDYSGTVLAIGLSPVIDI
jgi:hypothetical protein